MEWRSWFKILIQYWSHIRYVNKNHENKFYSKASPDIIRFGLSIPHDLEEVEWILEEEAEDLRERQEVFVRRGELSIIKWYK